jgi:hypothetical protein
MSDNIRIMGVYRGAGWTASVMYCVKDTYRTVDLEYDEAAEFLEAITANPDATFEYARTVAEANEKEINT